MSVQFAVLASGSRGNSTLVQSRGLGILIDVGLGPRVLRERLRHVGSDLDRVVAVVLSHTHRDHVDPATLKLLADRRIPFYCHAAHGSNLGSADGFKRLQRVGLVRDYDSRPLLLPNGFRAEPIALEHDSGPTFGFRIEVSTERRKQAISVGYLADTGRWTSRMVEALSDVDILGVEFNHDVELQRLSGRSPHLIARVLGARGHLSNEQGADLVREVFARSGRHAIQHLVLLHLSEQCNHPRLALRAANDAIDESGRKNRVVVHAARQNISHPNLCLIHPRRASRPLIWHPGPSAPIHMPHTSTELCKPKQELAELAPF